MGSDNFFSKLASMDPLARTLHLPGSDKYSQAVAQRNAGATDVNGGAFTGIAPTLAAANGGYTAGATGAPAGWQQINEGSNPSGIAGFMTHLSNVAANSNPASSGTFGKVPSFSNGNPNVPGAGNGSTLPPASAYVGAARAATQQQPWGQ